MGNERGHILYCHSEICIQLEDPLSLESLNDSCCESLFVLKNICDHAISQHLLFAEIHDISSQQGHILDYSNKTWFNKMAKASAFLLAIHRTFQCNTNCCIARWNLHIVINGLFLLRRCGWAWYCPPAGSEGTPSIMLRLQSEWGNKRERSSTLGLGTMTQAH